MDWVRGPTAWAVWLVATAVVALRCPEDISFAINSGDQEHQIGRVKYILGKGGWAGDSPYVSYRHAHALSPSPLVVYSSTINGTLPLGNGSASVPVTPCCGGIDFSRSIAEAQQMRERTFPLMLQQMPAETHWYVSTEDDVWWNLRGLCSVITETVQKLDASEDEPILLGGGATNQRIIYGPYMIMNPPMLRLFSNVTLLNVCRNRLMIPGNNEFERFVYPGAPYNLDHLVSYCVYHCFAQETGLRIHTAVKQTWPMKTGKRPEYFYHNGAGWTSSMRAPCFVLELSKFYPDEEVVAFHHASIEDMAFMEKRARSRAVGGDISNAITLLQAKCGDSN